MLFLISRKARFNVRFATATFLFLSFISGGCAGINYAGRSDSSQELSATLPVYQERVASLEQALTALSPDVDKSEAELLAETAISYSLELAGKYHMLRPPILHNLLVNLGLRERGLCIHWTEDLLNRLSGLGMKSLELHWGIANHDVLLRLEHSSVIITACGQSFEEGLVLDPWRHSGELYWTRVKDDSYPWKPEQDVIR
ncbi:MAG: hypothetical protein LUO89_05360 [Methanothrix sp.]|nr:hypothetical protein [Methanothrix sp.]